MPGAVATSFSGREPTEADRWKLQPEDVAETVAHLIATPPNVLVHRAEVRTLTPPPKKGS
jgi:NADP-dependent 3-hydroxy acid dehydrogenase YdfG